MTAATDALRRESYISLETYKKDGSGVKTPVWFVEVGGKLYVLTDGTSFKVKRLRRNPRAKIAACNVSGKEIKSPWFDANVAILDPGAEQDAAHAALRAKYGFQMWLLDVGAKIGGRYGRRKYLRIEA